MKRHKKNRWALVLLLLVIAGTILFLEWPDGDMATTLVQQEGSGIGLGDRAPDFTLMQVDGSSYQLSTVKGPVIVNFWASWCPPCEEEMPLFQTIHDTGAVHVVGVNLQEKKDTIKPWLQEQGITFPIVLDPTAQVKEAYGVFTQPVTYFLDADKRIVAKKFGLITEAEVKKHVQSIAKEGKSGSSIATQETRQEELDIQTTGGVKHLIPLDKVLSGGPGKDGIPSIDAPVFESREEGDTWLQDDDIIFGLFHNGIARAYAQRILNWHEIVNDEVGGDGVVITFCPLCGSAIAFDPRIDGEVVEFGVSGKLYNSDLLMYDRKTDTLWNQISGRAVVGELTGMRLQKISLDTLRWGDWKELYPETQVLSRTTGHIRDYSRYPYGSYETNSRLIFPVDHTDDRLHEKTVVYGLELDDTFKAYPLDQLEAEQVDTFAGRSIRITNNRGVVKFFDGGEEIVAVRNFWFAWVAHHPETELYAKEGVAS